MNDRAWGESTKPSRQRKERIEIFPNNPWAPGFLAAVLVRRGERDRANTLVKQIGDTPTPIWGRVWYHLLCSEIAQAAAWYASVVCRQVLRGEASLLDPVSCKSSQPTALAYAFRRGRPSWPQLTRRSAAHHQV